MLAIALALSSACNQSPRAPVVEEANTNGNSAAGLLNGGDVKTNEVAIGQAVKDRLEPGSVINLIGDGSGALGNACQPDENSSSGPKCACTFVYARSNDVAEAIDTSVTHVEPDFVRCGFGAVPADAKNVRVRLHILADDSYSNEVQFSEIGAELLNPSSLSSFIEPRRHLCRETISVPYTFGPNLGTKGMYDPVLSEHASIAVTFNFYASNMGKALVSYSNGSRNWECTGNPKSDPWGTYTVYTKSGQKIHDPARMAPNVRNRFLLARAPAGSFLTPVAGFAAPGSAGLDLLGYGAKPVPTGTNTERCPSTSIPTGFRWVKVWLFRADIESRPIPFSPRGSTNSIACAPIGAAQIVTGCNASKMLFRGNPTPAANGSPAYNGDTLCLDTIEGMPAESRATISDNTDRRRDYLFVVTPDTVMSRDFINDTDSSLANYKPVRYLGTPLDCPFNTNNPICKRLDYTIALGDAGHGGDLDEKSAKFFPICAIQEGNL